MTSRFIDYDLEIIFFDIDVLDMDMFVGKDNVWLSA